MDAKTTIPKAGETKTKEVPIANAQFDLANRVVTVTQVHEAGGPEHHVDITFGSLKTILAQLLIAESQHEGLMIAQRKIAAGDMSEVTDLEALKKKAAAHGGGRRA